MIGKSATGLFTFKGHLNKDTSAISNVTDRSCVVMLQFGVVNLMSTYAQDVGHVGLGTCKDEAV